MKRTTVLPLQVHHQRGATVEAGALVSGPFSPVDDVVPCGEQCRRQHGADLAAPSIEKHSHAAWARPGVICSSAARKRSSFGPMPRLRIEKIGYGIGTRDLASRPNVLRAILGELVKE